jgi:cyclopropane fatty-acyl-phospholipid synthase-like methyltransferase
MKEITAADYDRRIKDHSIQQIIDEYYEPKQIHAQRRVRIVLEAIQPQSHDRLLDIGCGAGTFAFHCSQADASCFGMDYSYESANIAQILAKRYQSQAKFVVADGCHIPFSGHCFDKVVAADFFEHLTLEDKDTILKEIKRVLKSNGIGVIFTPNGIREEIGALYWRVRHFLFGDRIPGTDLHFGLTNKLEFQRLLEGNGFTFCLRYHDLTRPYLARIPGIRTVFALNLLWVIKHRDMA